MRIKAIAHSFNKFQKQREMDVCNQMFKTCSRSPGSWRVSIWNSCVRQISVPFVLYVIYTQCINTHNHNKIKYFRDCNLPVLVSVHHIKPENHGEIINGPCITCIRVHYLSRLLSLLPRLYWREVKLYNLLIFINSFFLTMIDFSNLNVF